MNCHALREKLLAHETPQRPTDPLLARHLALCARCRAWVGRLARLEHACQQLPTPSSDDARDELLAQILSGEPLSRRREREGADSTRRRSVALVLGSLVFDRHASSRRRVGAGMVLGVAASLLLFVASWLAWYMRTAEPTAVASNRRSPIDTLVQDTERDLLHVAQSNPHAGVRQMAKRAQGLHSQALHTGAVNGEDLTRLAELYARVLRDGLLRQAEALPGEERRQLLEPIANDLEEARSQATRLSQRDDLSEKTRNALSRIASAAGTGSERLRWLSRDATS